MNNDSKIIDNFLKAIQKYSDKQKGLIEKEVISFKNSELKRAEDEGLEEAYKLIQEEITQKRTLIRTELAHKEQESRAELFKLRMEMTDKIFEEAKEKLLSFTSSEKYKEKLMKSAGKISKLFGSYPCTLYIKENDLHFAKDIASLFDTIPEITADNSIQIGGIKGKCISLSITADETLDTLLEAQRDWFVCNSTLKVV